LPNNIKETDTNSATKLINVATLPCKMKRSPSRYTTTPKRDKIPQKKQKSVSAYCWVVYSSSKSWYQVISPYWCYQLWWNKDCRNASL